MDTTSKASPSGLGRVKQGGGWSRPGHGLQLITARAVVLLAAIVAAWRFGGVRACDQQWVCLLLVVGMITYLAGLWLRPGASGWVPHAAWPLVAAVLLGGLQLVRLPAETLKWLSPQAYRWRSTLEQSALSMQTKLAQHKPSYAPQNTAAAALAGSEAPQVPGAARRWPVSLSPASTRVALALLLMGLSALVAGALLFGSSPAGLWLCGVLAANGAALAFFGLVQRLAWNGKLFWQVPLSHGGAPFGPFVNRNNAGGYLSVCLGAAVGFTTWALQRNWPHWAERYRTGLQAGCGRSVRKAGLLQSGTGKLQALWGKLAGVLADFLRALDGLAVAALALAGCIVGGILCSLSRGAIISATCAAVVTIVVLLAVRRSGRAAWTVGLALAAGVGLVGWVGMTDAVQQRLATLLDPQVRATARLPLWRDSLGLIADFPVTGAGLGTYRFAYRPYQQRLSGAWYHHAENQYLETLAEAGAGGLLLLAVTAGLMAWAVIRLLKCGVQTRAFALGLAGALALSGQLLAASFDFGIYQPANFLALALLCGAVCGRADRLGSQSMGRSAGTLPATTAAKGKGKLGRPPAAGSAAQATSGRWGGQLAVAGVVALLVAGGLWGFGQLRAQAAVERALTAGRFSGPPQQVSLQAIDAAIERLSGALAKRPDDAEAQHCMATLYLRRYRAEAFEELKGKYPQADREVLWQATSQIVLHRRAHEFARLDRRELLEQLRTHPVVSGSLPAALEHLLASYRACPLVPEVQLTIAELAWLVGDPQADRNWIEQARKLAVSDPEQLFHCGLVALQAGYRELAWTCWQQSLALSRKHLDDVLGLALAVADAEELAEEILPDDVAMLVELARDRLGGADQLPLRKAVLLRAQRLLAADRCDLPAEEKLYLQAAVEQLFGKGEQATATLSKAVRMQPANAQWRYELAMLLRKQGRLEEARRQALLSAQLVPANRQYRQLLQQINRERIVGSAGGL